MDKGYDNGRIYAECAERGVSPVIPLRKGCVNVEAPIAHGTDRWKAPYRRRSGVEREFGRLKHEYGLVIRVRGLARVQLQADLVMLARLAHELACATSAAVVTA